jgi:hypothetical protein
MTVFLWSFFVLSQRSHASLLTTTARASSSQLCVSSHIARYGTDGVPEPVRLQYSLAAPTLSSRSTVNTRQYHLCHLSTPKPGLSIDRTADYLASPPATTLSRDPRQLTHHLLPDSNPSPRSRQIRTMMDTLHRSHLLLFACMTGDDSES